MQIIPISRRARTILMAGAAAVALTGAVVPFSGALNAQTVAPLHSLVTPDGSFSEIVKMAKPAVVTIVTDIGAPQLAQNDQMAPGMPNGPGQNFGQNFGQNGPQQMPFDQFFRQFFGPNGPGGQMGPMGPQGMPQQPQQEARALGSGFIVSSDGYIVTNNHVIDKATKITVTLDDGRELPGKLIGTDPKTDIAVIKIDATNLPTVQWGNSDTTQVGDQVIAIGNPFGIGTTVTTGIVSARGRDLHNGPYDDFLQIDAAINHGNSGGPLFNVEGQVVGINAAIYSPNDGNVGVGFAIPSDMAQSVVKALETKGFVERGYLGVQIQNVTSDIASAVGLDTAKGALVAQVNDGTPAAKAGIKVGDVIVSLDGTKIDNSRELSRDVANLSPGQTGKFGIWRNGSEVDLNVTLASLPADTSVAPAVQAQPDNGTSVPSLGMNLSSLTPQLRQQLNLPDSTNGLVIMSIDPQSKIADSGLRQGDVIVSVNTQPVTSVQDVEKALTDASQQGKKSVLMLVERDGNQMFIGVPVGQV